jgi:hypothetical protein
MRSLFRFRRNTDDHEGGEGGAAAAAPSRIRRNGCRQTVVPSRRRPHWSTAKGQARLFTAFRATV